ncbi:MAG: hypothetical protein QF492_03515 [Candidatus Krumholzibacteria bacterium]|jgi:hypothetical protein|nr:hypothetical protein [Candidatus Krumholzibacteria bacterium]MDP6668966.1 hypothetical protein [Candidatus Krumholzibacteria bacterium]MDP7022444.1 hypothetical protein [Candidatus Krumholzibacteria bacterium]
MPELPRLLAGLFVFLATSTFAMDLLPEDPFLSYPIRSDSTTRLDLGSEFYHGKDWSGFRETFRLSRAISQDKSWQITLPWAWSTDSGEAVGGRGNIRAAFAWFLADKLSLSAELGLRFSSESLEPLELRRNLFRFGARTSGSGASWNYDAFLALITEAKGLTGEDEPGRVSLGEAAIRVGKNRGWSPCLSACSLFRRGAAPVWRAGAGLQVSWDQNWRVSLSAESFREGGGGSPALGISFQLQRNFPDPTGLPAETPAEIE